MKNDFMRGIIAEIQKADYSNLFRPQVSQCSQGFCEITIEILSDMLDKAGYDHSQSVYSIICDMSAVLAVCSLSSQGPLPAPVSVHLKTLKPAKSHQLQICSRVVGQNMPLVFTATDVFDANSELVASCQNTFRLNCASEAREGTGASN